MHNNFYFLRQLSDALHQRLLPAVVSECFSQHRDELIIRFETTGKSFYIKANLTAAFSCLSFPSDFQRARKNSVDLFDDLIGQHVQSVRQYENERSFSLLLTNDYVLLFKMHGNRSNIILFQQNTVTEIFKKSIAGDEAIDPESLDRKIDWSFEAFFLAKKNLPGQYFTFGKPVWKYLKQKNFDTLPDQQQWEKIIEVRNKLETPDHYLIVNDQHTLHLLLLPSGNIESEFEDPIEAVNDFYYRFIQQQTFSQERAASVSMIRVKLESGENFIQKNLQKLEEIENDNSYKVWADLIMANLHALKAGQEKAVVENFYNDNHPVEIKLKKDLTPQRNAEIFYRKAKNQHIEIQRLRQSVEVKQKEIENLQARLQTLESAEDLKSIRKVSQQFQEAHPEKKQTQLLPYHEFEFKGYRIWVGRNAQRNDELTLKYSYKEDLWLHAKDVPGSHVLIKHQAGKNFPKDVIEYAAQLAAYHSKRKTESLCPVAVTPKKFVRKRKGDPAGMVVVEREEVIMVEPRKS